MRAYINDRYKVARFSTDDVGEACAIGAWFNRDNPDLVKAHWELVAHRTSENLSHKQRREVEVSGADGLAKAIREGPPQESRPSGFVGPFGEDA